MTRGTSMPAGFLAASTCDRSKETGLWRKCWLRRMARCNRQPLMKVVFIVVSPVGGLVGC